MHPAYSVIFFTTASGAGYGLLAWLAMAVLMGWIDNPEAVRGFALAAFGAAFALVAGGLLSSTAHLGHPERAWRAFSQWRSSWLSREGVAAVVSFAPALGFAALWLLADDTTGPLFRTLAVATAAMAIVTVFCTAMIYRSLKPVHQWYNGYVVPNYLALSALTGGILFYAVSAVFGFAFDSVGTFVAFAALLGFMVRRRYWTFIDGSPARSTPETATGLGHIGRVSHFEGPHTQSNYLLKEMGYAVARKHAVKLRLIVHMALFLVPGASALIAQATGGAWAVAAVCLAVPAAAVGVVVERWLFFAEAKHAVTLYYGAESV